MPSHQSLAASARTFLASPSPALTDELRQLASDLAELARETDARLQRCDDFLQRGLRGEAVHLAEIEPPLLEVVAALDFPERAHWDDLAVRSGMPVGPRVNSQRGAAVYQACVDYQAIEPLLKEHRRLARARAPLADRVEALRQLAMSDFEGGFWIEDLQEAEHALIEELVEAGRQAHEHGDASGLGAIIASLEQTPWSLPPLPPLLRDLKQRFEDLRQRAEQQAAQQLRANLPNLARKLNQAVQEGLYPKAMQLWQQLESELQRAQVPPTDPIFGYVQPALQWLTQQQQEQEQQAAFAQAVQDFEQLLASPRVSEDQLRAAFQSLEAYQRPIPAGVAKRYQRLRDELREEKEQFREGIVSGISQIFRNIVYVVAAVALAAVVIGAVLVLARSR